MHPSSKLIPVGSAIQVQVNSHCYVANLLVIVGFKTRIKITIPFPKIAAPLRGYLLRISTGFAIKSDFATSIGVGLFSSGIDPFPEKKTAIHFCSLVDLDLDIMLNKKLASAGPSTSPGLAQLCNRFRTAVAGLGEVSNAQQLDKSRYCPASPTRVWATTSSSVCWHAIDHPDDDRPGSNKTEQIVFSFVNGVLLCFRMVPRTYCIELTTVCTGVSVHNKACVCGAQCK